MLTGKLECDIIEMIEGKVDGDDGEWGKQRKDKRICELEGAKSIRINRQQIIVYTILYYGFNGILFAPSIQYGIFGILYMEWLFN